jgi:hypothetical protein
MPRPISVTFDQVLNQSAVVPYILVEMLFDSGPIRLWTGLNDLVFNGNTYTGAGTLLSLSSVEETAEISAKGISVSLSGLDSSIISLALAEQYQNRRANIYFGVIGTTNYILLQDGSYLIDFNNDKFVQNDTSLNEFVTQFSGLIDQMTINDTGEVITVSVSIESRLIDLERARVWRYTSEDQKRVYPTDKGFDFVNDLKTKTLNWGRK